MTEPFIGEIQVFPFGFAPRGWAQCNGQLLPINQNQALFSLLGTMYGGDGRTTFALPDLRGRVPVGVGSGFAQGQKAGEEMHTLMRLRDARARPSGHRQLRVAFLPQPVRRNLGQAWAPDAYAASPNAQMASNAVAPAGGGQPHENRSPYLALNFCIALVGIFPSRS